MATSALPGWHPGELSIQRKLGFADAVKSNWQNVRRFMPEQHRIFHTHNLPFIPVATVDGTGRPWAAIVAGTSGGIGFVQSPDPQTLSVHARLWEGDPLLDTVRGLTALGGKLQAASERFLLAGLGVEFSTRRRNKFAGYIKEVKHLEGSEYQIDVNVTETVGNCPKYINVRSLVPCPRTQPTVLYHRPHMAPSERLPEEIIQFILEADTVFVGTKSKPETSPAGHFVPHAGMNARSGLPGFLRVRPSDGRTIVMPDYSGNRYVSSLGNIESTGLAAFTVVSFTTGDILYITGRAENLVGPAALKIMARHTVITTMQVTGFMFVQNALPVRQKVGTTVERSPYSPKVKYLVEEADAQGDDNGQHKAVLEKAVQHTSDLATFTFKVVAKPGARDLRIRPGQAIVLDFMDWIGPPEYHHMADSAPSSINDDRVRTWTVSSAHESKDVASFDLTMREMKAGAVTGALFDLLREHPSNKWGTPIYFRWLSHHKLDLLWVAGGIGVTPFLSMFAALADRGLSVDANITLLLSTRESEAMLSLIWPLLMRISPAITVKIDVFTSVGPFEARDIGMRNVQVYIHRGRVGSDYWLNIPMSKKVFICGPNSFGDSATEGLRAAGLPMSEIHREGFF
ncbi:hypothetical protein N7468_003156 [Penicillium chermesinum]|uniref:FAD-binding FR-type domain-containing protein n=1 Tax=Penicillium chermesinum TaxID=63820 RepID=A0A9W9TRJ9_9EURO|nr:uncharacterized protein N7468_003156 [Penicillium chermesinum]KAJ5238537.1 hypothetical protein N7468_003156 [Penicillium chermesinum]